MDRKYTTVLFDADDTLLDFGKDETDALTKVMKEYDVPITEENIRIYKEINLGMWKALERGELTKPELKRTRFKLFFEAIGFETEKDPFEINERYLSLLGEGGNLIDGVRELLSYLKDKGYDLYIVTNGIAATQAKRLAKAGILPYFIDTFVSEAVGHQKPKREYFDYVLSHIKERDKRKVILIGDSLTSDIKGAMNGDIDCIWLNRKNAELPEGYTPLWVVEEISEIGKIL